MDRKSVVRSSKILVDKIETYSNKELPVSSKNEISRKDNGSILLQPKLIAEYTQLFINVIIASTIFYVIIHFFLMLKNDVQSRVQQITRSEINRVKMCEKNYIQNQCEPDLRVPALDGICTEWFECMNDSRILNGGSFQYKSAKLWAQTLASVINAFVDEIKIKAFIFLLISIFFAIFTINITFSSLITSYKGSDTNRLEASS